MASTSSPSSTSAVGANVAGTEVDAVDLQEREVVAGVRRDELGRDRLGLPGRRTRISVAPSTTWAFVRISPSAASTMPVPTERPCTRSALIVTTDGPTESTTARAPATATVAAPSTMTGGRSSEVTMRSASGSSPAEPMRAPSSPAAIAVPATAATSGQRRVGRPAGRARRARLDPGGWWRQHRHPVVSISPQRRRLVARSGTGAAGHLLAAGAHSRTRCRVSRPRSATSSRRS